MIGRQLVIFGTGQIAELAHFYFTHDSDFEVAAFTVDEAFLTDKQFCGCPVVPFEQLEQHYPPDRFALFVAVSYAKLNEVRRAKVAAGRERNYQIASYLSTRATVFPGFVAKPNCFILEENTIQPFAEVGENVTLWSGNHIGHHARIGDNVFVASEVVVSGGVVIGDGCFIGVNVTIRDQITIGRQCVLGAGALVLDDQPDFAVCAPRGTERAKVPSTRLRGL